MAAATTNGGAARRPSINARHPTAPTVMTANGHFAAADAPSKESYQHGVQVVDADKIFNQNLSTYLNLENVTPTGFNYHLISVFGSQSTGKSTLLNKLFGTSFDVMDERRRAQTTKGIWLSKNKREQDMAQNILVMDVEGTDGRERGEDQDFERKSALFALATSEVLIVNMWEQQVGLYQGANMGLLKTVFEVNLQLFLKDHKAAPRSLLFFVIRDHLGATPMANLKETLLQDLARIWASLSKPPGLENSTIDDYFDFAFVALPHKILKPEEFDSAVHKLGLRFREGYRDPRMSAISPNEEMDALLLPEYHRRIPADGFAMYASGIWDQIESNKDLDLPTQQELLAQYRCDEISRDVLIIFDEVIVPLEEQQAEALKLGKTSVLPGLGVSMREARQAVLRDFETEASRYHKRVYQMKQKELQDKVDGRLKALFLGQLTAAHKREVKKFSDAVSEEVRLNQKRGSNYDFAQIVETQKATALANFEKEAESLVIDGASFSNYTQELKLFTKDLAEVSARLRKDEMRRLATRVERWVKSRLNEAIGLHFNSLGSTHGKSAAAAAEEGQTEKDLWDRIWKTFTEVVEHAESRFTERAKGFDASPEEVEVGLWRLRRKSWAALRAKVDEEVMEGNILLKLRENFEDKFRYDAEGVPRIWRPNDDIEGVYTAARSSTLTLIPLLSRFKLSTTSAPPPLEAWIGSTPASVVPADEEDLPSIGGVDDDEGKSIEEEMTILSDAKAADLSTRFKKTADGVYVEAKRSALGGITQVPLYFYALLLILGWNELMAVLRSPLYFITLAAVLAGAYTTYNLNLWGPMIRMADAATKQGLEIGKEKLRDFLEAQDGSGASRRSGRAGEEYEMSNLSGKTAKASQEDDIDDI